VVANGDTLSNGQNVTIDAGTRDGVHINMTVVTGYGLIGNIVAADRDTSTVQLLIDPSISVGVRNARTNKVGTVSGGTNGNLDLTQYDQTSDIRVGDQLETLGSKDNEPYVPDVPVGKVISVANTPGAATHTAVVASFASFDSLDLVAIIFPPTTQLPHGFFIAPITPAPTTSATTAPTTTPVAPPASTNLLGAASGSPAASTTPTTGTHSSAAQTTSHSAAPPTTPTHTPTTTPKTGTTTTPAGHTTAPKTTPAKPTTGKPISAKPTTPHSATTTTHATTTPPPHVTPTA
jgi:rod shape-determining protein MreC